MLQNPATFPVLHYNRGQVVAGLDLHEAVPVSVGLSHATKV